MDLQSRENPVSVFFRPYSGILRHPRSGVLQRDMLHFCLFYILVSLKTSLRGAGRGGKLVPLLNKVSKPLILIQPSHFTNDETEVQGGGSSDLSESVWPISKTRSKKSGLLTWAVFLPPALC